MSATSDFDSWMDDEAKPRGGDVRVWDRWPDALKDEILRVCARNDARPERVVPIPSLQARWLHHYDVRVGKDSLRKYCSTVLGRRSFTQAV
jgi:hypothetical protein